MGRCLRFGTVVICRISLNHDFMTLQKCKTLLALHYKEWEHILWSDETKTEGGERKKVNIG